MKEGRENERKKEKLLFFLQDRFLFLGFRVSELRWVLSVGLLQWLEEANQ
jgi:hypothetical protein